MHAQSVNPLFPNVSLPVREKAVVGAGESAKKSEYTGQPIAPAEVKIFFLDLKILTEYSSVAIR
jgi:hypothetical protein